MNEGMVEDGARNSRQRDSTVERIRSATQRLIARDGLDVTMEEIAAEAAVGRATVFRHFESRDHLLAAALLDTMERYERSLPPTDGPWEQWLRQLCETAHSIQAHYGWGYWELMFRADLPEPVAAVERRRREVRDGITRSAASTLWDKIGGPGDAPDDLVAVLGTHLSARFTSAVIGDGQSDATAAAEYAYAAIERVVLVELARPSRHQTAHLN